MNVSLGKIRYAVIYLTPLTIIIFSFFLARSEAFFLNPVSLSKAITLDLLVTAPLLYFLLIQKTAIPKISAISLGVIGILLAGLILPKDHQILLSSIKVWLVPVLEIIIFSYIGYKVWQTKKEYKRQKTPHADFYTLIKKVCKESLPKGMGPLLATEISIFYYFLSPFKKKETKEFEFSYHKKSGIVSVVSVLLFLVVIETFVIHLFVNKFSHFWAWILTALSLYAFVQILGLVRSLSKRPIVIDKDSGQLLMRYGFSMDGKTSFDNISHVELNRKTLAEKGGIIALSQFGILESHNTIIHFKSPVKFDRLYGLTKECKGIAVNFDEKELFIEKIQDFLQAH